MAAFEYAPAPESRDVARLRASYGIFLDGRFRAGAGEAIKTVKKWRYEPATHEGQPITVYRIVRIPFKLRA